MAASEGVQGLRQLAQGRLAERLAYNVRAAGSASTPMPRFSSRSAAAQFQSWNRYTAPKEGVCALAGCRRFPGPVSAHFRRAYAKVSLGPRKRLPSRT